MKKIFFVIRHLILIILIFTLLYLSEIILTLIKVFSPKHAEAYLNKVVPINSKHILAVIRFTMNLKTVFLNSPEELQIPKHQPFIIVSNHQSLIDILIIYYFFINYPVRFILKNSLAHGFLYVSDVIRTQRQGRIDRENPKQAIQEIKRLSKRARHYNTPIVIFPEGTRARNGKVKEFKNAGIKTILRDGPLPAALIAIDKSYIFPNILTTKYFPRDVIHVKLLKYYPSISLKESEARTAEFQMRIHNALKTGLTDTYEV